MNSSREMKGDLKSLFFKYRSWTDKESSHGYGDIYEHWVSRINPIESILEIGCNQFGGGSLLAFAERLPSAKIIGIDHEWTSSTQQIRDIPNIHTFTGNAYLPETHPFEGVILLRKHPGLSKLPQI